MKELNVISYFVYGSECLDNINIYQITLLLATFV